MLRALIERLLRFVPRKRVNVLVTASPLEPGRYEITLATVAGDAVYWKVVQRTRHWEGWPRDDG